ANGTVAQQIVPEDLSRWAKFLLAFDVGYRQRRLHFLIEGQNRLYQLLDQAAFDGLDPLVVDRLKRAFYARLETLRQRESAAFYTGKTHDLVRAISPGAPLAGEINDPQAFAEGFVDRHGDDIDRLIDQLAVEIDLSASTHELDSLLASLNPAQWH